MEGLGGCWLTVTYHFLFTQHCSNSFIPIGPFNLHNFRKTGLSTFFRWSTWDPGHWETRNELRTHLFSGRKAPLCSGSVGDLLGLLPARTPAPDSPRAPLPERPATGHHVSAISLTSACSGSLSLRNFWPVSFKSWQFLLSCKRIEIMFEFHRWKGRGWTSSMFCLSSFSFFLKTCGPLWAQQCGSQYYTTGVCSDVSPDFWLLASFSPAIQSKLRMCRGWEQHLALNEGKTLINECRHPTPQLYFTLSLTFIWREVWLTCGNLFLLSSSM